MESGVFCIVSILGITQCDSVLSCTQPDHVEFLVRTKVVGRQRPGGIIVQSTLVRPLVPFIDDLVEVIRPFSIIVATREQFDGNHEHAVILC